MIRIIQSFLKYAMKGPPVVFNTIVCCLFLYCIPFQATSITQYVAADTSISAFVETPDSNVTLCPE